MGSKTGIFLFVAHILRPKQRRLHYFQASRESVKQYEECNRAARQSYRSLHRGEGRPLTPAARASSSCGGFCYRHFVLWHFFPVNFNQVRRKRVTSSSRRRPKKKILLLSARACPTLFSFPASHFLPDQHSLPPKMKLVATHSTIEMNRLFSRAVDL